MDAENPVIRLCIDGMTAEVEGRTEAAGELFREAWERSVDAYDRAISAHYLARQQPSPEQTLWWNEESLRCAEAVGGERVEAFLPSLFLNVGDSLERLGRCSEARGKYVEALAKLEALPAGLQPEHVRASLQASIARTGVIIASPLSDTH